MHKILFLFCLCLYSLWGIGPIVVEPKIGIAPYQSFQDKTESETLSNFFDYGVDFYSSSDYLKGFQLGIGAEIKRLHPLLIDKKVVGLFFTLFKIPSLLDTKFVIRAGFLQNLDYFDTTLDRTFYYALGIEKSFYRMNFQVLFDDMGIKNSNINAHYQSVVLKIGIKI